MLEFLEMRFLFTGFIKLAEHRPWVVGSTIGEKPGWEQNQHVTHDNIVWVSGSSHDWRLSLDSVTWPSQFELISLICKEFWLISDSIDSVFQTTQIYHILPTNHAPILQPYCQSFQLWSHQPTTTYNVLLIWLLTNTIL